ACPRRSAPRPRGSPCRCSPPSRRSSSATWSRPWPRPSPRS
ncbi:MAG: hypothetical protein AVDCRST_MAG79-759, partial [uncultured Thermoleophilia bacterium]